MQSKYDAPLVLPKPVLKQVLGILYDLFMFTQLVAFYGLCWSLGLTCLLIDKLLGTSRCLDAFTTFFALFANLGKKAP